MRDGSIFVYQNLDSGNFATRLSFSTTGLVGPFGSKAGQDSNETGQLVDVTSDGILDYVISKDNEGSGNRGIYIYAGTGTGTFNTTLIVTNESSGLTDFQSDFDSTESTYLVHLITPQANPFSMTINEDTAFVNLGGTMDITTSTLPDGSYTLYLRFGHT